jgi:TatD DNase family protein
MRFLLFHRIHPWYIVADRVEADLGIIVNCKKRIVLPGRMRLQKDWNTARIATNGFEKQLLLAQKYNKPVVIHCVAAFQVIDTKREDFSSMIIHGFSKKEQLAGNYW